MGKKIVLDTNILISSVGWEGNPRKILEKCEKKEIELIISLEQFNEFSKVLEYPKFDFNEEQKNKFRSLISEIATVIQPKEKISIITEDPDDNIILEAALEGKANYIVTGDNHLLKLKQFKNISIVTAKEFLKKC